MIFLGYTMLAQWMGEDKYYQWFQYSLEPVLWDHYE